MFSSINDPIIAEVKYCEDTVRNDIHQHNEYEIIYVVEGEAEITINNVVHHVTDQTLVFLTNLENHSVKQISEQYSRYFVTLHTVPTDSVIRNPDILCVLKNHANSFPNCVDVSSISNVVTNIFEELMLCKPSDLFVNELVGGYLSKLLIYVLRLVPYQLDVTSFACKQRILNVQTYLDVHYRENIRIDTLAKEYFISPCYLSRQFKQLTGYSPKQYLNMVRMKNAAVMLVSADTQINEIAAACGFSDINNFIKQFKYIFGCTPSSFRSQT